MRILKVFLSLCLIGGLLFIGYYGVSTWQSDRLHDSLSSAVEEARRTTTPTATAAATATAASTAAPTATATATAAPTAAPTATATATSVPTAAPKATVTATAAPTAAPTVTATATAEPTAAPTATATATTAPSAAPTATATTTAAPTTASTATMTATAEPTAAPTATATATAAPTTAPTATATATAAPTTAPTATATATAAPTAAPTATVTATAAPSAAPTATAVPSLPPQQEGVNPEGTEYVDPILASYAELAEQNPDMIGWVYIEGTRVDYPVMYRPDDKNFYLHRNFNKKYSIDGIPFMDERCDPWLPSDNLIIYGHNMRSGAMFNSLQQYVKEEFWNEHPLVQFDTLEEKNTYEVFAVIPVNLVRDMNDERMRCYGVLLTQDQLQIDTLERYVKRYAARHRLAALPRVGDEVLTLSTCTGFANADRLVVMARRLLEGEEPAYLQELEGAEAPQPHSGQ